MEFQLDNGNYQIVFSTSNLNIAIEESAPLNVIIGDTTEIDVGQVMTYIKSGEKEINEAVQQRIAFFDSNAQEKTDIFNVNATEVQAKINAIVPDIKEDINNLYKNKQDNLSSINAGTGISIVGSGANVLISNTQTSAEWGNITGVLSNQTDLQNILNEKQTILTFDNTPMSNSSNPVTSNGIYEAIDNIMQNISSGLEIGDIGFAPLGIDEAQNKRRYLNGQVISQAQFVSFTNKIKAAIQFYPNIITTEENWQAEVTNSKLGQCGKFVIDDTLGTIRLPKVVNINGLQDLALMGNIKAESLPNITGTLPLNVGTDATLITGAFDPEKRSVFGYTAGGSNNDTNTSFNASRSSSTYQDNAPVQQEAVQYPYFIQVATGTEESVDVTREIELNNPFSLLDYKWSEYEISNASWLLSNGAFHSGATYVAVYELLLKLYNGTETKDGVNVKLSTEAYEDTDFVINTADTTFRLPIKVKLASGNAVVGNGMTLGLTNGTQIGGLVQTGTSGLSYLYAVDNQYGANVGTSEIAGGTVLDWQKSVGVTTDPTKSGIETSSSGLKLYFYVGETIQDANVIAASQVLTTIADCVRKSSATDRETVVGWGIPDYTAEVRLGGPSTYQILPCDCLVTYNRDSGTSTESAGFYYANEDESFVRAFRQVLVYERIGLGLFISKGWKVKALNSGSTIYYYPLKGVN